MKWTRIGLLAAWGAAMIVGLAFYASRRGDGRSTPASARPVLDPALVAQTARRASAGDVPAQLQMGIWCLEGQGQAPDYRQAARWLRPAAQAGNAEAEYRLGTLYQAGQGIERDPTNAVFWFKQAAAQHHGAALYNLGAMCEAGEGGAPDTHAAARYFQQAAELGDAYAQYNLARRCEEGHGVPKDQVQAWTWYDLANAGGVPDTLHARQALAARLTAAQLDAARRAVAEFRRRVATARQTNHP